MPIYVFRCGNCGEKFERLQKLSDPDPVSCPHCHKRAVHRQMTAPAFRLAGKGWYETDFKSAGEHKYNLAGDGGKPQGKAVHAPSSGAKTAPAGSGAKAASAGGA